MCCSEVTRKLEAIITDGGEMAQKARGARFRLITTCFEPTITEGLNEVLRETLNENKPGHADSIQQLINSKQEKIDGRLQALTIARSLLDPKQFKSAFEEIEKQCQ